MSDKNLRGHFCAFSANMMWGLMAPIGKAALVFFTPMMLTSLRMIGACAIFWLLSFFSKDEKIDRKDHIRIMIASIFALILNQGSFIYGLSLTSPINASIIATTMPIITMVAAALYLREPITSKKIIGIFIGASGALILVLNSTSGGGDSSIWGDLLVLVAQLSFATYLTVFKDLTQRYSPISLNKWMFLYASIVYLPFTVDGAANINWGDIPWEAYADVAFVVLCGSILAYIFIMAAQRLLRPTVVSMYNYVQPIVSSIAAIAMGVGVFGWEKGLAIALVFIGVYIVTQSKSRADLTTTK